MPSTDEASTLGLVSHTHTHIFGAHISQDQTSPNSENIERGPALGLGVTTAAGAVGVHRETASGI